MNIQIIMNYKVPILQMSLWSLFWLSTVRDGEEKYTAYGCKNRHGLLMERQNFFQVS